MSNDTFTQPAHDPFMAGSSNHPAVKFANVGDTAAGVVTAVDERADTAPDGTVKKWDDGTPRKVYVFTLDDNGELHSLWVRGQMVSAIRDAAKQAGLPTVIGSKLTIQHHALGEAKKGFSAAKLYRAKFEPAPARVDTDSPF